MIRYWMILLVLSGCSLFELEKEEPFSTVPSEEYEILSEGAEISVEFKDKPDAWSFEQICSLSRGGDQVDIRFDWENNKSLLIEAVEPLVPGLEYRLDIQGIFRTADGNENESDQSIPFYYITSDFDFLCVRSVSPESGTGFSGNTSIEISFNGELDESSLAEGMNISPDCEVDRITAGTFLTLTPCKGWNNLSSYTISLNEKLKDRSGRSLYPEWEYTFYSESSANSPAILQAGSCSGGRTLSFPFTAADLNSLDADEAIRIRFSEPMDEGKCEEAFSLSPSLSGDFYWIDADLPDGRKDMVFVPDGSFLMNQEYTLRIASSAENSGGIRMISDYLRDFTPAIPLLTLDSLECSSLGGPTLTSFSSVSAVDLPAAVVSPYDLIFRLSFNRPFAGDDEKTAVQEGLDIYEVFSSGGSPVTGYFSWSDDYTLTVLFSGFRADTASEYYYVFDLDGGEQGIRNDEGSFLSDSVQQLFRVPKQ